MCVSFPTLGVDKYVHLDIAVSHACNLIPVTAAFALEFTFNCLSMHAFIWVYSSEREVVLEPGLDVRKGNSENLPPDM